MINQVLAYLSGLSDQGQAPPMFSAPTPQVPGVQHATAVAPRMDASLEIGLFHRLTTRPIMTSDQHELFRIGQGSGGYPVRPIQSSLQAVAGGPPQNVILGENLSYEEEPVSILDREVRKLRSREIASIKVQWMNQPVEESNWEKEADMEERYPHLFTDSGTPFRPCFSSSDRSRTNDG
ncbi:uncharacterized protein [Solanum lycopersicum]|uniref:uncharacterized protein n=1 Tax=Solanum lycopersicum TaxID=4081 RepID=UPI003747ED22